MSGHYDDYTPYPPYYTPAHGIQAPPEEQLITSLPQHPPLPTTFGYQSYTPVEEYHGGFDPGQANARVRRRTGAGGEHVKHRRTRSGCYTCRNRRVKCDEVRPICDRCRKGSRDCVYPEPTTSKTKRRDSRDSKTAHPDSDESPDAEDADAAYEDDDETVSLATTQDADSSAPSKSTLPKRPAKIQNPSATPSLQRSTSSTSVNTKSASDQAQGADQFSPMTESSGNILGDMATPAANQRWADLPRDLRFYLDFYVANINSFHYFFKYTPSEWLHTTLIDTALSYEPLLYAIVGFASYHHSVARRAGKIHDFLRYYNKSVTMLRLSLTKQHTSNVAMLMTILQLATIEEYLGDWVSLLSHQRAAFQIVMTLYTPETASHTETARMVLAWYLRFDISGAMLSGSGTFLPRQWFALRCKYYDDQARDQPTNLSFQYWYLAAQLALICSDAATLWARRSRGEVSDEEFDRETKGLEASLTNYEQQFPPALLDPSKFVKDFSSSPPRNPDDIVDPYDPNFLFGEPIWRTNVMLLDWWALELMFKHQLASMRRQPPAADLLDLALKMLKMFEAVELYPNSPPGTLVALQASLGVACIFVPNDHRHSMWIRKKLASVEASGFTYPKMYRQKMSEHWGVDLSHWWLPNNEGFPPILGSIRSLIHDRSEGPPRDQMSAAIRDMRGIFDHLALADDAPSESPDSAVPRSEGKGKSRSSSVQEPYGSTYDDMEQ